MTFESFEASLPNATVTSAVGKLVATFPVAPRLSFPAKCELLKPLCSYLEALDTFAPQEQSTHPPSRTKQIEIQDTPHPRYVTELLAGIFRGLTDDPEAAAASTVYVKKRLDDHVLAKGTSIPWRRAPGYLIVKVALQTMLREKSVSDIHGYKMFQAYMLGHVLDEAVRRDLPGDMLHTLRVKVARRFFKLSELVESNRQCIRTFYCCTALTDLVQHDISLSSLLSEC